MTLTLISQPHQTRHIRDEFDRLKEEIFAVMKKYKTVKSRAVIYTKDTRYIFPLHQLEDQQAARRAVIKIAAEKHADFFVIVGLTHQANEIDSSFANYFLNFIGHLEEKVVWRRHQLMFAEDGTPTVIKIEESMSGIDNTEADETVTAIVDQEDEFEGLKTNESGEVH